MRLEPMDKVRWFLAINTVLLWTVYLNGVEAGKCYKDKNIGEREGNVYHCNSKDLPRCCQDHGTATCCMDETSRNVEEQLQLWGTVAGMILLIGLLFVCCKNDITFCNSDSSLKEQWRNFRTKRPETPKSLDSKRDSFDSRHYYDNPIGGFDKGGGHGLDPYHYPYTPPGDRRGSYHKFDSVFA